MNAIKMKIMILITSILLFASHAKAITADEIYHIGQYVNSVISPNYSYSKHAHSNIFNVATPPSIEKTRDALFYLEFSESVNDKNSSVIGWNRIENISYPSGFFASIYKHENNIIVAFRGSEIGTSDWVTNGIMVQGMIPEQYQQAIDESQRIITQYSEFSITFTGHSLGGGLATTAALSTGKPAYVFDSSGISNAITNLISSSINSQWQSASNNIINFNLEGEFVSDADKQQDADTLGVDSYQYGNIYYLSSERYTPRPILDNGLTRHFTKPLKEELSFLSQPIYRTNPYDLYSDGNNINENLATLYIDLTDDSLDVINWSTRYFIDSLPSVWNDILK